MIPTVDREGSLADALCALAVAARRWEEPVEVIVVDDSHPPARHRAATWEVDGLAVRRVWTAERGRGPAAARNLGLAEAAYDLVAFTDDDVRCDAGWLAAAAGRLRGDLALAGVEGAVHVDLDRPVDPVRSRIVMNLRGGGYLTASLFLRAAAARAVGGFRQLRADGNAWAFPYREDTDLGLRVIAAVGPITFAPEAVVYHPAEPVDLVRLVRLAHYYVVDAAFARLHPEAAPVLWRRPLARLRIRLACVTTLALPLLAVPRTRRTASLIILALSAAVSAQVESELRSAGLRRPVPMAARDTFRRLPRSLVWSVAAGSARLQGEVMVRLGWAVPPDQS